ncbi:hypothetical protein MASR2M66_01630 [Chloroflexota bacterium]
MPVKITIIGLGQIGGSIGLSLAEHKDKVLITGHDKEFGIEQKAKKLGAVTETNHNLPDSVENADLVILALPVDQIRETLGFIAKDLRKDVVIMDTSPVKAEVLKWVQEILPDTAHYIGVVPAIGPEYMSLSGSGLDSAKPDLFKKGIFFVSTSSGAPGAALKLITDLVELLGSSTVLTDFVESDGLMAATHILPRLTSAALVNAATNLPGWVEMRKAAGRGFYAATSAFEADEIGALAMLASQNREGAIRSVNALMNALLDLREDLEKADDESLRKRLLSAQEGRDTWVFERGQADWTHVPASNVERPSLIQSLFGVNFGKSGKKKN